MTGPVGLDSPAVQSYVTILQGVVSRMATNSASAKSWCIALVSAIIVVIADKGQPRYVWISLFPIALFFLLDAYYLGLERQFRTQYNSFIAKLHEGKAAVEDVFVLAPLGGKLSLKETVKACGSVSIWPFYSLLTLMLLAVRVWIL